MPFSCNPENGTPSCPKKKANLHRKEKCNDKNGTHQGQTEPLSEEPAT